MLLASEDIKQKHNEPPCFKKKKKKFFFITLGSGIHTAVGPANSWIKPQYTKGSRTVRQADAVGTMIPTAYSCNAQKPAM